MSDEWTRSISWSKMSTYDTCARQFKFDYVEDEAEEEHDQFREDGINIHEYFDQFYDEQPDEPDEQAATDLAQEMFDEAEQARYRPWIEQFFEWNQWLFKKRGPKHWKPVYTEKWVEVEIEGKTHHGYIDAIHWDPERGTYGVVDYKPNAKDNSRYKGQVAYYGDFLLEVSDLLDAEVEWGGIYGYKGGKFKTWDIHWASSKATKRKIDALVNLENGYDPDFGFPCQYCDYMEECMVEEQNEGGDLLDV